VNARWALGPEVKRAALAGGAMLYDSSRVGGMSADWFEARYWAARREIEAYARGRGAVLYIKAADGKRYVLRHYRRGGAVASLAGDRYFWHGEQRTRPFLEWQLTYRLHRAGLPVPAPIAVRDRHRGIVYSGDIITERLPVVGSLASCLATAALSVLTWVAIGRCLRRFHELGVCHADLNAHNVLLSEESVYLVDFDRCQLRAPSMWRDANLVRLRRSLEKVTWALPAERFGESDWHALLDGYRERPGGSEPQPPP
jgi:3-deoxy-D-manno-octulosonic acid kinase